MLRVTNLPALVTELLLNWLHVAHLLLTKCSFRDRVTILRFHLRDVASGKTPSFVRKGVQPKKFYFKPNGWIRQIEILEKTLPELQVKVMLPAGCRLDVGLARSISSDHINQSILELVLLLLEPWKVGQARLQRL